MLSELHIQNYVLIDRLVIRFLPGLNVLTGETGAGKSILLGALSLILGEKADQSVIRGGYNECTVSALCTIDEHSLAHEWLEERGVTLEMNQLLIRRVVKKTGRGGVFIQAVPVTLQELAAFTALLLDIHGQHAHQSLLRANTHRVLLDNYSHLTDRVAEIQRSHTELSTLKKRYETLNSYQHTHRHELELLQHAVQEIRTADLQPHEEEELQSQITILSQSEQLQSLLSECYQLLSATPGGILTQQQKLRIAIEQVSTIDRRLVKQSERIDSAYYELEDVAETLGEELRNARYDPAQLKQHQDRLDIINTLQAKYGNSIDKIREYVEEAEAQITELMSWAENKSKMEAEIATIQRTLVDQAQKVSSVRSKRAAELEQRIIPILKQLGIQYADFRISVTQRKNDAGAVLCGAYGIDTVEFLIRTNSGEPVRRLSKIASGGEISRVMLALKTVFGASDRIDTMIFDEVDTGIGGAVARAVGAHLHALSREKQVLCVTHLASIAARADHHLCVSKETRSERTLTNVAIISGAEREQEIARMLAGDIKTDESLAYAKRLLTEAADGI